MVFVFFSSDKHMMILFLKWSAFPLDRLITYHIILGYYRHINFLP